MAAQLINPFLRGQYAAQDQNMRAEEGQLRAMGVLAQLQAQKEAQAQAREMRPLQLQALQAQVGKTLADQQREQQFRGAITAAGPDADQGTLTRIAAQFSSPDKVMDVNQRSLDRQSQQQATMAAAQEKIQASIEAARQRGADQMAIKQMEMAGRRDLMQLAAGLRQPPQPRALQLTSDAQGNQLIVNPDGTTRPLTASDGSVIKKPGPSERAMPPSLSNKYLENVQNLRKAEQAVTLLEGKDIGVTQGDKQATGKKGLLTSFGVVGDKVLNWADPKGVDTRAAVGDLGSMVIHDRSGAAVTAAEFPRLRPFIPLSSDSPEVALKKTRRFAQEYKAEVEAQQEFFKESGYKVPTVGGATPKAPPTTRDVRSEADKILGL